MCLKHSYKSRIDFFSPLKRGSNRPTIMWRGNRKQKHTGNARALRRLLMASLRSVRVQVLLGLGSNRSRILALVFFGHGKWKLFYRPSKQVVGLSMKWYIGIFLELRATTPSNLWNIYVDYYTPCIGDCNLNLSNFVENTSKFELLVLSSSFCSCLTFGRMYCISHGTAVLLGIFARMPHVGQILHHLRIWYQVRADDVKELITPFETWYNYGTLSTRISISRNISVKCRAKRISSYCIIRMIFRSMIKLVIGRETLLNMEKNK